jgi:hypothetical protein
VSVLNKIASALLLTALVVVVTGCGGYKGPPLAKCEGTVTYNGNPVEGANVTMSNSQGVANGTTDASGKFKMETVQGGKGWDGAPIGTLKVAISKMASDNTVDELGPAPPKDDQAANEAYMKKAMEIQMKKQQQGGGDATPKSLIPGKYSKQDTSELTVELPKEGKTDIVFDLKD